MPNEDPNQLVNSETQKKKPNKKVDGNSSRPRNRKVVTFQSAFPAVLTRYKVVVRIVRQKVSYVYDFKCSVDIICTFYQHGLSGPLGKGNENYSETEAKLLGENE